MGVVVDPLDGLPKDGGGIKAPADPCGCMAGSDVLLLVLVVEEWRKLLLLADRETDSATMPAAARALAWRSRSIMSCCIIIRCSGVNCEDEDEEEEGAADCVGCA